MSRLICAAEDLLDGGDAWRFEWDAGQGPLPAFVFRWRGQLHAYVNRCAHVAIELDWNPGKFLDDSGEFLMCATHGALYAPDSGLCVAGPCVGKRLQPLKVFEENRQVFFEDGSDHG